MYNIIKAKQLFNRNRTPQTSMTKRQNSSGLDSNQSSSVSKTRALNSTINTLKNTINSFHHKPNRDRIQNYTIDVQQTNEKSSIKKIQNVFHDSLRKQRKQATIEMPKIHVNAISHSKSLNYGRKDSDTCDDLNNTKLIQQNIYEEPQKQIINSGDELRKIKEQMNEMQKTLEPQELEIDELDYQIDYKKIDLNVFSLDEIRFLEQEFEKEEYERNYLSMDKILIKNKFFQRFEQGIRIGIMEKASMETHEVDDKILQLGENSNNLYVILRGSCQQTLVLDIQLENYQQLTVQSYYDGQDLSEINLLQLNNNRGYSTNKYIDQIEELKEHPKLRTLLVNEGIKLVTSYISCAEKTFLLRMDNDQFQKILKQSIEKNKEFKLSVLSQIRFFQHTSASQLLHLVAELGIQNYYQGACVVKKGDKLDRVIIIASGEFDIVEEIQLQREIRNYKLEEKLKPFKFKSHHDKNTKPEKIRDRADQSFDLSITRNYLLEDKLKPLKQKRYDDKNTKPNKILDIVDQSIDESKTNNQQLEDQLKTNNNYLDKLFKSSKCYQYCNKQIKDKDCIQYTHLHVLKTLKKCDVICGRALLKIYDKKYEGDDIKLTVVTKSVQGSIFFLDEKRYQNLPENLQNQILAGLRAMKEFDDYEIQHIQKQITSWEKEKQKIYQSFIKEKRQKTYKLY